MCKTDGGVTVCTKNSPVHVTGVCAGNDVDPMHEDSGRMMDGLFKGLRLDSISVCKVYPRKNPTRDTANSLFDNIVCMLYK